MIFSSKKKMPYSAIVMTQKNPPPFWLVGCVCFVFKPSHHHSRQTAPHLLPEETFPGWEIGAFEQGVLQDALNTFGPSRTPAFRRVRGMRGWGLIFLGGIHSWFFCMEDEVGDVCLFFLVFWWVFLGDFCWGKPGNHDLKANLYFQPSPPESRTFKGRDGKKRRKNLDSVYISRKKST